MSEIETPLVQAPAVGSEAVAATISPVEEPTAPAGKTVAPDDRQAEMEAPAADVVETRDVRVDAAVSRLAETSTEDDAAAIAVLVDVHDRLHSVLVNP